jgi:hypothetical protein
MERPIFEVKLIEPATRKVLFQTSAAAEAEAEAPPKRKLKLVLKKKAPAAPAPAPEPKPAPKKEEVSKKKTKVDNVSKYLKSYSGAFQDYTDSRDEEVIYPTKDIKSIINLAYNNKTLSEIMEIVGYNKEETAAIIFDNYINPRADVKNPKTYLYEDEVRKLIEKS